MPLYNQALSYHTAPSDRSYLAEVMPASVCASTSALATAGTLYLSKIKFPVTTSVTNLICSLTTAGGTLTAGQCFTALFTSAGVLVGQSADQAAAWGSGAPKQVTAALTGGPFVCAAGNYYVGWWFNGTTGPSLARPGAGNAAVMNAGLAAPNLLSSTADTGLTTTAPSPFGAQSSTSTWYWAAVS